MHKIAYALCLLLGFALEAEGQVLGLKEAIQTAVKNYGTIRAKENFLEAAKAATKDAALAYLPNLSVGAQQAYGTANGQFGPVIGAGGLNVAASGPPFSYQNWNAAFGALYLANLNWDFFTFGRVKQRIRVAEAQVERETDDLEQERFQHEIRTAGAYLNLLAAQRIRLTQQKNLERATALRNVVIARTLNGLNPGVDSSLANAEVSNAKIALANALSNEADQQNTLAQLMGVSPADFQADTLFLTKVPSSVHDTASRAAPEHPVLKFYQSRVDFSRQQEKFIDRSKYPVFTFVGVIQGRGSGFNVDYNEQHPSAFTRDYLKGTEPTRTNYLLGVGLTWNLTSIKRIQQQLASQRWTSRGFQSEFELANQQINAQVKLASQKMEYAVASYNEAPVQMKAASDAYLQKTVLYRNGLANIIDVTQALFTLNRAETDRDISSTNIWQALLLEAAARGDFNLFMNEF